MNWEIVALTLGVGALALGFYWLRTSGRRAISVEQLDERLGRVERLVNSEQREPMPLPRGLPARGMR